MTWAMSSKVKPINVKLLKEYFKYKDGHFIRIKQTGWAKKGSVVLGTKHHSGYTVFKFANKIYLFHRLVWAYHFGDTKMQIDHINRNKSDNRIKNLRLVTGVQNLANAKAQKNNKSTGLKNIYFCKVEKYFYIAIQSNGVRKKYGFTKDLQKAIKIRNQKLKEINGEYAAY